jgi:GNAT superfamily N-acetyltransferase
MQTLPDYEIHVYGDGHELPAEAEELFRRQLDDFRRAHTQDRGDGGSWRFALVCAVTPGAHVLGGVYLDIGPIGGSGPLATERLAYLERTLVRPEYRRQGLATRLMREAIEVVRRAGCLYIRCSNNWDNEAERRLLLRCGFALIDLDGEANEEPCYLAVRPVQ